MDIKDIKKIVTHLHLDGSIDIELAKKYAKEDGYDLSNDEIVKELQVDKDCHNLNDYLKKFTLSCSLLQTKERLESTTYALFKKLYFENVIYVELRFAPIKHLEKGLS